MEKKKPEPPSARERAVQVDMFSGPQKSSSPSIQGLERIWGSCQGDQLRDSASSSSSGHCHLRGRAVPSLEAQGAEDGQEGPSAATGERPPLAPSRASTWRSPAWIQMEPTGVSNAKIHRQPRIVKRVKRAGREKPGHIISGHGRGKGAHRQTWKNQELQRCIVNILTKSDRVSRHQNKHRLERERDRIRGLRGATGVFNFRPCLRWVNPYHGRVSPFFPLTCHHPRQPPLRPSWPGDGVLSSSPPRSHTFTGKCWEAESVSRWGVLHFSTSYLPCTQLLSEAPSKPMLMSSNSSRSMVA